MKLGNALKTAQLRLEKQEVELKELRYFKENSKREPLQKPAPVSKSVYDLDDEKTNRILYLEERYKQLIIHCLGLYPISLTTLQEDGQPSLNLDDIAKHLLEQARIQLQPGEKLERKIYYQIGNGSPTSRKGF